MRVPSRVRGVFSPLRDPAKLTVAAVTLLAVAVPAQAVPGPGGVWSPTEVVAQPVPEVSTGASPAALYQQGGVWRVVYESQGDIWYRERAPQGWRDPVRISNNPAPSRDPHIATLGDGLMVVWEDERTGHAEIWSRRFAGGSWQPEIAITDNAYPSHHPAIAATDTFAYVVWDHGPAGLRAVRGAPWLSFGSNRALLRGRDRG